MEEIKELTELEGLENKYEDTRKQPANYSGKSEVEPLLGDELEVYMNLTVEEKQERYSIEQCEATDRLIEIQQKTNEELLELEKQINIKAIEAYNAVVLQTSEIEKQIEENNRYITALDEQIKELKDNIEAKEQALHQMKSSEELDQTEYEKLQKEIEELKNELKVKENIKQAKLKSNDKYNEQLEVLKGKKEQLVKKYQVVQHQVEINGLSQSFKEKDAKERELYKEYEALKGTDEYKNKDEEAMKKANQLAKAILDSRSERENMKGRMLELREKIDELIGRQTLRVSKEEIKEEKNMVEEVGESVEKTGEKLDGKTSEKPNEKKKGDDEDKKTKPNSQNFASAPQNDSKIDEKKQVDPQEEFEDLYYKAKKGTLKDAEFDKLLAIMKDPVSYDKFGITTGIIFNKSRRIFRTLEKHIQNIDGLSSKVKQEFAKEIVGTSSGKALLIKIAELDKETLTESQQATLEEVKTTLGKYESLEQAKYVRDRIALEKRERRWSWLIDFSEDRERLSKAPGEKEEKTSDKGTGKSFGEVNSQEDIDRFNSEYVPPTAGELSRDREQV